mmetsp:Transcript_11752/g.16789  ORF Transcript_11752/g.16789 Transcript_11752/m.16789 type:complete len:210 (+) Transcript_11752:42-671(+)
MAVQLSTIASTSLMRKRSTLSHHYHNPSLINVFVLAVIVSSVVSCLAFYNMPDHDTHPVNHPLHPHRLSAGDHNNNNNNNTLMISATMVMEKKKKNLMFRDGVKKISVFSVGNQDHHSQLSVRSGGETLTIRIIISKEFRWKESMYPMVHAMQCLIQIMWMIQHQHHNNNNKKKKKKKYYDTNGQICWIDYLAKMRTTTAAIMLMLMLT